MLFLKRQQEKKEKKKHKQFEGYSLKNNNFLDMFRRSLPRAVHLFSALIPTLDVAKEPIVFNTEQLAAAQTALEERKHLFREIDLTTPLKTLSRPLTIHDKRVTTTQLSSCVDGLRSMLYQKFCDKAVDRLQIHEAIMAAGFYERAICPTQLSGENIRFVLNHYNFDVRRDTIITQLIHHSLTECKEISEDSEKLVRDILLLERRLYGKYRFTPTAGRRWLVLGLRLSDIDSEEEFNRITNLSAVKEDGNFTVSEIDNEKLWKTIKLIPGEENFHSFAEVSGVYKDGNLEKNLQLELRVQKPIPPMEFWDRFKDKLLRYWVIWFSLWVMFFMVDEEIITLVALFVLKWKQTAILEEEAKRTGGKVYIASSTGRSTV